MNTDISLKNIKDRVKITVTDLTEIDHSSTIGDDDDLFLHGMSSRASVALMLGLESEFDIEFPESMLNRENFKSVNCISKSIEEILTQLQQS
jgi:acyl carrier protein